ncbi:hypothetical protein Q3G72_005536 [Acer saccharum]|nr:hypothetical protein Q3G72_005536 [Acer saccharum]
MNKGVDDTMQLLKERNDSSSTANKVPRGPFWTTEVEEAESSLISDYTRKVSSVLKLRKSCWRFDAAGNYRSGGQKKQRATTGEKIVGPTKTLFMDEISIGLDRPTTYHIVKCLQQIVHLTEASILMSLLRPAPETFDFFDDIILLSEGQIVYEGPREHILQFSETCGYRCPERKGTADFLQEKTSAYVSQNDGHLGDLTVKETLDYSARFQGVGFRYDLVKELSNREKGAGIHPEADVYLFMKATAVLEGAESNLIIDYTLKVSPIRKLCHRIAQIWSRQLHNISNVECMQQIAHLTEATILMSLLQPDPETFDLFDDIILLSEGQIVYQGPREHVLEFFWSFGFKCLERKGIADFLQEASGNVSSLGVAVLGKFDVNPKEYCLIVEVLTFCLWQRVPKWRTWCYYIFPVAWTVYGLIVTQYGDIEDAIKVLGTPDPSIKWYVQNHFGVDLSFMGPTAVIVVAFAAFFALLFAV